MLYIFSNKLLIFCVKKISIRLDDYVGFIRHEDCCHYLFMRAILALRYIFEALVVVTKLHQKLQIMIKTHS